MDDGLGIYIASKYNWMDHPKLTLFIIIVLFFYGLYLLFTKEGTVQRIGLTLAVFTFFTAPAPVYEVVIKPLGKETGLLFIAVMTMLIFTALAGCRKALDELDKHD